MMVLLLVAILFSTCLAACISMPRDTVVVCPGAPESAVGRCQVLSATSSTQRDVLSTAMPIRGFGVVGFGSGGSRSATDIDDDRYMRCMRQAGYNCVVEKYLTQDGRVAPSNSPYVVVPDNSQIKTRELDKTQ